MNVLVVGAGMYVTGRGGFGNATVLASLAQLNREGVVDRVVIAARDPDNAERIGVTTARINSLLNSRLDVTYQPVAGVDLEHEVATLCAAKAFDAAIVAVPDHLHAAALRALLKACVPSMVVKPFVPTLAEARELLRLQREHRTYGVVEFHKRFDEGNLYAKRIIAEGALGTLLYLSVAYSQRITIPTVVFRDWADRTNIFQYLGVHYVDLVHFLTGLAPIRLTAYGTRGVLQARGIDTFDSVHVMVEWSGADRRNSFLTHFDTNWIDPSSSSALSDQRFTVVGTQGRLECDQKKRGIEVVRENAGVSHINPYFSEFLPDADGNVAFQGYGHRSIAQFVQDVRRLRAGDVTLDYLEAHRPSFKQALVSTAVVEAVNRALAAPLAWTEVDDLS